MDAIDRECREAIKRITGEMRKLPLDPQLIDVLEAHSEYLVRLEARIVRVEKEMEKQTGQ